MNCPYCAEEIKPDALKCKHCGEWLSGPSAISPTAHGHSEARPNYSSYESFLVGIREQTGKYSDLRVFGHDADHARSEAVRVMHPGSTFDDL